MIRFNERFKEAREYFGMNRADFAKKLRISPTTVTRYEEGSMDIAMKSVNKVAEKLGIRLEWLLGLSDNMYDADIEYKNIPILKTTIKNPTFNMENFEGFEILKADYEVDFCIKESNRTIFFKKQVAAENGDVVAALSNGAVSVAKYMKIGKHNILVTGDKWTQPLDDAAIIGKAVYIFSEVE